MSGYRKQPPAPEKPWAQGATRPTDQIRPNPFNPRGPVEPGDVAELADSIRAQGILQPLLITPEGIIVAGHRRHAAAQLAGLREVPVIVRRLSEDEQLEIMLVENLQRADLSPIQEAQAFKRLLDSGSRTQADVGRRVGVPLHRIQSRLALLKLEPEVQERFHRGELPAAFGDVLIDVPDPHQQKRLAALAARRMITAAAMHKLVERATGSGTIRTAPAPAVEPSEESIDPGLSQSRRNALEWLEQDSGRLVSFRNVATTFQGVCCACGMESLPEVCAACPLAEFMARLAQLPKAQGLAA